MARNSRPRKRRAHPSSRVLEGHARRWGRGLGVAIVDALRRVVIAAYRDARQEGDAAWDDDDWPPDLLEDGTRIDADAGANMAYWARRRAVAASEDVPPLSASVVESQAQRLGGAISQQAMRDAVRAGASPRKLAQRLDISADRVLAAHLSAVESVEAVTWAAETLALVTGDAREAAIDSAAWLVSQVERGATWRRIAAGVQDRVGVVERRAARIARDQVGNLQHRMTRAAHEAAGISGYLWRAVGDEATREAHAEAHRRSDRGHVYTWGRPEVVGVMGDLVEPGEDVECRCTAFPVVDRELRRG